MRSCRRRDDATALAFQQLIALKGQLVAALWEREAKGLARYAMVRTGGDKAAAEDLVQQTFMAAFLQWDESLAGLDAEERRNWLRSVCRRRWIDGIRRETLGDRLQADVERLYDRVSPDPAHAVIARDDLDRCWQVLRQLSPRRREVALLYFIEQQSVLRIAEILGIQASGVRKHVAKARQARFLKPWTVQCPARGAPKLKLRSLPMGWHTLRARRPISDVGAGSRNARPPIQAARALAMRSNASQSRPRSWSCPTRHP
ncbi:sigma-70 family RNA polymerase sigma factor [Streptomyces canus]|uniref:RNA polymerase sigma factor n=1 Tax=Streptomyces canus TaxID=58343 RepID=UPI002E347A0D|nr:sigma-70 family RNA polymerase sigma factor [Streptomyces canus]